MSAPGNTGYDQSYDFGMLCTPHYQALVNYANRLLPGRPQEARDLVQEAYLRAARLWHKWNPSTGEDSMQAARGWLHRIVQNLFLDHARAHKGHRKLLEEHQDVVISQTYGVDSDHHVQDISDGIGDEVRQALDELDRDHRAVVDRCDFAGETYLAAADALGIPLGTVMSRLHRGRKRLAATLMAYARDEYGIYKKEIVVKVGGRRPRFAQGTQVGITAAPEVEGDDESDCSEVRGDVISDDGVVFESADRDVTVVAENPSDSSGCMAVVDAGSIPVSQD